MSGRYIDLKKNPLRLLACLLLVMVYWLLSSSWIQAVGAATHMEEPVFLNDRAADIIGAGPMLIPGLITPGGLSGQGVTVALADSGIDKGSVTDIHPDLASEPGEMPRIVSLKSYSGRSIADDPVGHGTHMAATMVGSGAASQGQYQGIAPEASLYVQGLLDENGDLKVPENLIELFLPAYEDGVRIHVNGWGGGTNSYGSHAAQIDRFVNSHPDFLTLVGAGNTGPQNGTLSTVANSKNALVIGSSQVPRPAFSAEAHNAQLATPSSSSGPAQGQRIKPDLLAPGSAVISARSSSVKGNFPANSAYTRMGGSSMATAVAGGATALLYEYLQKEQKIMQPGSALLKALLINGARIPETGLNAQTGYGILDLAATLLALKENSFKIVPIMRDIGPGQVFEYKLSVQDTTRPVKATLAWVDPAAADGRAESLLVNDLDLIIEDPAGHIYYGNDFQNLGIRDNKNNVEQIVINQPIPGEYKITLSGAHLNQVVTEKKLALVCGQPLKQGIVQSREGNRVVLDDGTDLDLSSYVTYYNHFDHNLDKDTVGIAAVGSDLYQGKKTVYVFSRFWRGEGVQILKEDHKNLLVEMNPAQREGGYYLDSAQGWPNDRTLLNNGVISSLAEIPNGTEIKAWINPSRQTIWGFQSYYRKVEGFIQSIDVNRKELKLAQDEHAYTWLTEMAIGWQDNYISIGEEDGPYGTADSMQLERLLPSMSVTLFLAPDSEQIQYISIYRYLAMGVIEDIDAENRTIKLAGGEAYEVFSGAAFQRDGRSITFSELQPGMKAALLLLSQDSPAIQVQTYSQVLYGKIIYAGMEQNQLYLLDHENTFHILNLSPEVNIYKNGLEVGTRLEVGTWARLILEPDEQLVKRIDMASPLLEDEVKYFDSYNKETQELAMTDGVRYKLTEYTNLNKNGFVILPELLLKGEALKITTLFTHGTEKEFLSYCQGMNPAATEQLIEVTASIYNGVLIIRGKADCSAVYVHRQNGEWITVPVNRDGSFSYMMLPEPGEKSLQVLGLSLSSRNLYGTEVKIDDITPANPKRTFFDIAGHPAQEAIEKLADLGIINGYEDGNFAPDRAITRAEFLTMLSKALNWKINPENNLAYFADNADIPVWALEAVYYARQNHLISGFPDGSFQPQLRIDRSQMVVMVDRILKPDQADEPREEDAGLPYLDQEEIPLWVADAFTRLYEKGILDFWGNRYIRSQNYLTRGEAAIIVEAVLRQQNALQDKAMEVGDQLPEPDNAV